MPPSLSSSTPPPGVSAEAVELAQRISQLADMNGNLRVPPELVPTLTAEVTAALGRHKSPPSLSARRRLIEDWYASTVSRLYPPTSGPAATSSSPSRPACVWPPSDGLSQSSEFKFSPQLDRAGGLSLSPIGSPPLGSPLGSPLQYGTASRGGDASAHALFLSLAGVEAVSQLLPLPAVHAEELQRTAAHVHALTGALPTGDTTPELQARRVTGAHASVPHALPVAIAHATAPARLPTPLHAPSTPPHPVARTKHASPCARRPS